MSASIIIHRAGPLATIQDFGRPGYLTSGISASGPIDRSAFLRAGMALKTSACSGIEFSMTGIDFELQGEPVTAGFAGGTFKLSINGDAKPWPHTQPLHPGDKVQIAPGPSGNFGYCRFNGDIDVPEILGSRATNLVTGLGGFEGKALKAGDTLTLKPTADCARNDMASPSVQPDSNFPIRFVWGIHADKFDAATREAFTSATFKISTQIDRMGARLVDPNDVFANARILSLVSDAVFAGDIQILGDGTPIVLLRDHQPTGGYPRIGTVISADLDRFVQIRPHQPVRFAPVTLKKAHSLLAGKAS